MVVTALMLIIGGTNRSYSQTEDFSSLELSTKINHLYQSDGTNALSIQIVITNNGNSPQTLYPYNLLLVDSKTREFLEADSFQLQGQGYAISDGDCSSTFSVDVNPGLSQTLYLCYEIPKDTGSQFSIKLYNISQDLCNAMPNYCETKIYPVEGSLPSIQVGRPTISSPSVGVNTQEVIISGGAANTNGTCTSTDCFNPQVVNIDTGDTVTWTNEDTVGHTVTSGKANDNQYGTIFDSSLIQPGKEYSFTFQNAGTYPYLCQVHPWMTGEVMVSVAGGTNIQPNPTAFVKISTDKSSYNYGDKITILGNVQPLISGIPLSVTVRDTRNNVISLSSVNPNSDGTFQTQISTDNKWSQTGFYQVFVEYGSASISSQTSFYYSNIPIISTPQPTQDHHLQIQSNLTFPQNSSFYDLPISMTGGNQSNVSYQIDNSSFTTYKNNEYHFTVEYPKAWKIEENYPSNLHGNLGIVDFRYDGANYSGDVSVWGKITNVTTSGNQYLNQMSDNLKQRCANKTLSTDGFTCNYIPLGADIVKENGKYIYLVTYQEQITEAPNSSYPNESDTCLQAHIPKNSDLWEINSCDNEDVTNNPISSKISQAVWVEIASHAIATFTVSENPLVNTNKISNTASIPQWVHNTAKWWSQGTVSDNDFNQGIQYLIQQKIIHVPPQNQTGQGVQQVPAWVKNTAGWWANGKMSDDDFLKGIEYLVRLGIIKV